MKLEDISPSMLKDVESMQQRISSEISSIQVEASTGGGMVTVGMNGNKRITKIVIEPVATEDIEMLQDMVRGAVNEASRRVDQESRQKMGGMLMGLGLPGLQG